MQFFKGRKKIKKAQELCNYYRKEVMKEDILKNIGYENFSNLMDVARFAELGRSTAIQTAFCLGYKAGKGGAENEQE